MTVSAIIQRPSEGPASSTAGMGSNGNANGISNTGMRVLIAGAGIVGLAIAQGCLENGIPFAIFERDEDRDERQGWALTLHWCLEALERTIGPRLAGLLPTAVVDSTLKKDEGNFLFLDASTCEIRYKIPPTKRRLRLHRQKLRSVLSRDLDIQYGKRLKAFRKTPEGRVIASFDDGSVEEGSILIGADGNNSAVRKSLNNMPLERLPINLIGVVRHFTPEQAAPMRAKDPLLFHGLEPETENYMWYSIQEVFHEPDGRLSFDALVIVSWLIKDEEKDNVPDSDAERVALMKKRAAKFAEPMHSAVMDIPDDIQHTTRLQLGDYPGHTWDHQGIATLAGDAAHAMTMYRGEGANHALLDAALLVDQLKLLKSGTITQKDALNTYEAELWPRAKAAVLKSRRACLDAHRWSTITDDSPFIGERTPPETAFRKNA